MRSYHRDKAGAVREMALPIADHKRGRIAKQHSFWRPKPEQGPKSHGACHVQEVLAGDSRPQQELSPAVITPLGGIEELGGNTSMALGRPTGWSTVWLQSPSPP